MSANTILTPEEKEMAAQKRKKVMRTVSVCATTGILAGAAGFGIGFFLGRKPKPEVPEQDSSDVDQETGETIGGL